MNAWRGCHWFWNQKIPVGHPNLLVDKLYGFSVRVCPSVPDPAGSCGVNWSWLVDELAQTFFSQSATEHVHKSSLFGEPMTPGLALSVEIVGNIHWQGRLIVVSVKEADLLDELALWQLNSEKNRNFNAPSSENLWLQGLCWVLKYVVMCIGKEDWLLFLVCIFLLLEDLPQILENWRMSRNLHLFVEYITPGLVLRVGIVRHIYWKGRLSFLSLKLVTWRTFPNFVFLEKICEEGNSPSMRHKVHQGLWWGAENLE